MIWGAVGGAAAGFVVGWLARWWEQRGNPLYEVQCGTCHEVKHAGPGKQIRVEIWVPPGLMVKQWNVGKRGDFRDSRAPGPWLYDAIAAEVRRIELLQDHRLVVPPVDPPAGIALRLDDGGAA